MSKNVQIQLLALAIAGAIVNIRHNGGEAQPLPEGNDSLLNLKPGDTVTIEVHEAAVRATTETRSIDAGEVTASTAESRAASSPDEAARIADADLERLAADAAADAAAETAADPAANRAAKPGRNQA